MVLARGLTINGQDDLTFLVCCDPKRMQRDRRTIMPAAAAV